MLGEMQTWLLWNTAYFQQFEQRTMQPSNYTFRFYTQRKDNIDLHSSLCTNVHGLLITLETWRQPKLLSDDEEIKYCASI